MSNVTELFQFKNGFCSRNTMKNYKYCIKKLEKIVKEYFYLNIKLIDNIVRFYGINDYERNIEISETDIKLLIMEI